MNMLFEWEMKEVANPTWLGGTRWLKGSRNAYDADFILVQPQ